MTDLTERYGRPRTATRSVIAVAAALALVFLGWLAWATWFHSTPAAESQLVGYQVVDEHEATAVLQVDLEPGVRATCRVRALAEDHSVVGEVAFTPEDGRNTVSIRTEREATAVERLGCTAPGQPRPR